MGRSTDGVAMGVSAAAQTAPQAQRSASGMQRPLGLPKGFTLQVRSEGSRQSALDRHVVVQRQCERGPPAGQQRQDEPAPQEAPEPGRHSCTSLEGPESVA